MINHKNLFINLINNFRICKLAHFSNWTNSRNYKISSFKNYQDIEKLSSFGIVRLFDISHYPKIWQFSYLSFDMNLFSIFVCWFFLLYSSDSHRSIFQPSLIFKFQTSAILKFYRNKPISDTDDETDDLPIFGIFIVLQIK